MSNRPVWLQFLLGATICGLALFAFLHFLAPRTYVSFATISVANNAKPIASSDITAHEQQLWIQTNILCSLEIAELAAKSDRIAKRFNAGGFVSCPSARVPADMI